MIAWRAYWFAPAPYLDLAVVRIIAVATQLWILLDRTHLHLASMTLGDGYWDPVVVQRILNALIGLSGRPSDALVTGVYGCALIAGAAALIGLATNVSLAVFAVATTYVFSFLYSFGDSHHREAVMVIALGALAVSPSGHRLSVDSWLLRRSGRARTGETSEFAGWPLKLIGWWFVLMYLSAVVGKLVHGGLDWANGYTLQYYLARDGIRHGRELGVWLSQFHDLVWLMQIGVLLFQATFVLAMLYPRSRWFYVPAGLLLHIGIFVLMKAAFWPWIALYAVFVPWSEAVRRGRRILGDVRSPEPAT